MTDLTMCRRIAQQLNQDGVISDAELSEVFQAIEVLQNVESAESLVARMLEAYQAYSANKFDSLVAEYRESMEP